MAVTSAFLRKQVRAAKNAAMMAARARRRTEAWGCKIRWPPYETEFEIQAHLYAELRALGFRVRGNIMSADNNFLDLVVFDDANNVIALIEVKKEIHKHDWDDPIFMKALRAQVQRYCDLGGPVHLIVGMKKAEAFLAKIRRNGGKLPTKAWGAACLRQETP